jgi:hypothetical protein
LHYLSTDIMVNLFETPPVGFHYHGQLPIINPASGAPSKLARFIEDDKVNRKIKYVDLFCKYKLDIADKPQVTCLCCLKTFACGYYKNSEEFDLTNLFRHLQSKHPEQLSPSDQTVIDTVETPPVKLGIAAMLAGGLSYSKNKANNTTTLKKKVTTAIASMVADKGSFPFQMIEDPAFRNGVRAVVRLYAPDAIVPFGSRRSLRIRVAEIVTASAKRHREKFQQILAKRKNRQMFPVFNDSTTTRSKNSHTCLGTSLIDTSKEGSWILESFPMDCSVNERLVSHTAIEGYKQLKRKVAEFLGEDEDNFDPKKKINAGVFDKGGNTPRSGLEQQSIAVIACGGHRLNTLMDHMNKVQDWVAATEPVYNVLSTVRKSVWNTDYCAKVQLELDPNKRAVNVINGASTRWYYEPKSLRRADKLFNAFKVMDVKKMYFKNKAKQIEWTDNIHKWKHESVYHLAIHLPLMTRIEFWINWVQQSRCVTISGMRYLMDDLDAFSITLRGVLEEKKADIPVYSVYDNLDNCLNKFQDELEVVLGPEHNSIMFRVAEVLDNRFALTTKKRHAKRPALNSLHTHSSKNYIISTLLEFYDTNPIAKGLFEVGPPALIEPAAVDDARDDDRGDDDDDDDRDSFTDEIGPEIAPDSNIDLVRLAFEKECIAYERYLRTDYSTVTDQSLRLNRNPLKGQWPKLREAMPLLSSLAASILEIPSSVGEGERWFSLLNNVVPKTRTSLEGDLAGLICLHAMRERQVKLAKSEPVIPNYGSLTSDIIIEDWDEENEDDDYDENEQDQADIDSDEDGEDDDGYVSEPDFDDNGNEINASAPGSSSSHASPNPTNRPDRRSRIPSQLAGGLINRMESRWLS